MKGMSNFLNYEKVNKAWTLLPSSWVIMDFFKWPLSCVSCLPFFFIICFLRWRITEVKFFTPWYLLVIVLWKWGRWMIRCYRLNEPSSTQRDFPTNHTNGQSQLLAMRHYHYQPVGRTFTSDWSANTFIMVVCGKMFLNFSQNLLSKARLQNISRRQQWENYLWTVTTECSSCRMIKSKQHICGSRLYTKVCEFVRISCSLLLLRVCHDFLISSKKAEFTEEPPGCYNESFAVMVWIQM